MRVKSERNKENRKIRKTTEKKKDRSVALSRVQRY